MSDIKFNSSSPSDFHELIDTPSARLPKSSSAFEDGAFASQHLPKPQERTLLGSITQNRVVKVLQKSSFIQKIQDVFKHIRGMHGDERERRNTRNADDPQLQESLLGAAALRSDWEGRLAPSDLISANQTDKAQHNGTAPIPVIAQAKKKFFYKFLEWGGATGGVLNVLFSAVSYAVKIITDVISPLAPAIPFIGLANGLMHGFRFGKGIDRLRFYGHLADELKARHYDEQNKNFGPYSAVHLTDYPHLEGLEISPSRLLQLLESEVSRKRLKYGFYLAARTLAVGSSIAGFIGGLTAFAVPVLALPAICVGIPLAVASIVLDVVGGRLSNMRMDPLLRKPQKT